MKFDCIILGGGAAGLFCASIAAQRGRNVLVLERAEKVGKKILISGGGRCNFTNLHTKPENYNDILVNGQHFFIDSNNQKPSFSYENNRFEFKFGLLDFTKQSKLQYFYYLEGLEKTWVNAGNKAEVVYNYVPPGHYVFHVKAVDADGHEMKQQLSFAFEITRN